MKMNGNHELLARIARRGWLLVGLLGIAFLAADAGRAQSNAPAAQSQDAKPAPGGAAAAQTPASAAKSAAVAAKPEAATEEKSAAKGTQEGIKIHGHWTIEVKNPDGKVVTHREFENALTGNGGSLLRNILGRYSAVGYWSIYLTLSPTAVANGGLSPCVASFKGLLTPGPNGLASNLCFITEPQISLSSLASSINQLGGCSGSTDCANNLLVSTYSSPLTLTGNVVASRGGTIDTVGTDLSQCTSKINGVVVPSIFTNSACSGSFLGDFDQLSSFSEATFPTANGQQPVPVTGAGQTIAVTVQFTFN